MRKGLLVVGLCALFVVGGCRARKVVPDMDTTLSPTAVVAFVRTSTPELFPTLTPIATPTRASTSTCIVTRTVLPSRTCTRTVEPTQEPKATPTQTLEAQVVATSAASIAYGSLSIPAFDLSEALYLDSDLAYPRLDRERIGEVIDRTFETVVLRNALLELTLIPELGGRIYRCVYLPTGQELFYQAPVLKPTHWGPTDQGWWLAVGGLEFCLPVEEHGYLTSEPWDCTAWANLDGSVTARVECSDVMRNTQASANITLPAGRAGFELEMAIVNVGDNNTNCQYWVNGMMSPGVNTIRDSLQIYCPSEHVVVHSRGDDRLPAGGGWMSWPTYAGIDWSRYGSWRNWLGFFAPDLLTSAAGVYDTEQALGMVRVFDDDVAGTKMFGFGSEFGDTGQYTDDGSTYFEMWGGLTAAFDQDLSLAPGQTAEWREDWWVVSGLPELTAVDGDIAVYAERSGSQLSIGLASPTLVTGQLEVAIDAGAVLQECSVVIDPERAWRDVIDLGAVGQGDKVSVEISLADQVLELVVW